MQSHHVLPAAAQDGEVVAVTAIDDETSIAPTAVWHLYRLAYDTGASRITRAYRLHPATAAVAGGAEPHSTDSTEADGSAAATADATTREWRRFAAAEGAASVPILASTIVAYLGVRGGPVVALSPAEVATLDRSMTLGKLASSLPTLKGAPLQRAVAESEVAEANAAWQRTRTPAATVVASAPSAASLQQLQGATAVAVPEASVDHLQVQLRRHRRSWWDLFRVTFLLDWRLAHVVVCSFMGLAMIFVLYLPLGLTYDGRRRNDDFADVGLPRQTWRRCHLSFETPTARASWSFNPMFHDCAEEAWSDEAPRSYLVSDSAVTLASHGDDTQSLVENAASVAVGFLRNASTSPYRVALGRGSKSHGMEDLLFRATLVAVFLIAAAILTSWVQVSSIRDHRQEGLSAHLRLLGMPDSAEMASRLLHFWLISAPTVTVAIVLFAWFFDTPGAAAFVAAQLVLPALGAQAQLLAVVVRPRFANVLSVAALGGPLFAMLTFLQGSGASVDALLVLVSPAVAGLFGLLQALTPGYVQLSVSVGWACATLVMQTVLYTALAWYAGRVWPSEDASRADGDGLPNPLHLLLGRGRLSNTDRDDDDDDTFELTAGASDERLALRLVNVAKAFDGEQVLNLSMNLKRGDSVALLGHNGAGKSTLLSILLGKIKADRYSTASVFGFDLNRDLDTVRANTGFCPQKNVFIRSQNPRATITQVAQLRGAAVDTAEIDALLRYLEIEGDHSVIGRTAGEQRRVAVACAFVGKPALVLLDEPTTGIDDASRKKIWELIALQQKRGATILMSTHSMEEAETACNQIAVMANGTIAAQGSAAQLKRTYRTGHRLTLLHARSETDERPGVADGVSSAPAATTSRFEAALATALVSKLHPGATLAAEYPGVSHEYYLPVLALSSAEGEANDFEALLRGIEQNQAQLGVASYELREPSLEDVCLHVIESSVGADAAATGAAVVERTLRDMDALQSAFEPARTPREASSFDCKPFLQSLRIVARLRMAYVRAHCFDEVMSGVVAPILLIVLAFSLPFVLFTSSSAPAAASLFVSRPTSSQCDAVLRQLSAEVADITYVTDNSIIPRTRPGFGGDGPVVFTRFRADGATCVATILTRESSSTAAATVAISVARAVAMAGNDAAGQAVPRVAFAAAQAHSTDDDDDDEKGRALASRILGPIGVVVAMIVHALHSARTTERLTAMSPLLAVHGLGPSGLTFINLCIDALTQCAVVTPALAISLLAGHRADVLPPHAIALTVIATALLCVTSPLWSHIAVRLVAVAVVIFGTEFGFIFGLHRYMIFQLFCASTPWTAWAFIFIFPDDAAINTAALVFVHLPLGILAHLRAGSDHPALHHVNRVDLNGAVPMATHSDADVEREAARINRESAMPAGRPADAVAFNRVAFTYNPNSIFSTAAMTIKNASWGVREGEILGIVGPNGAGKTTTLNLALKNLKPLSPGGITYGGLPSDYSGSDVWRLIGFGWCPQLDAYDARDDYTAVDYLRLHLELRLGREPFGPVRSGGLAHDFGHLDAAQWWQYALNSLAVFDIPAEMAVRRMSGGMQRRLSAALALFCGASVVVLDEPTNGVDPMARQQMWRVMRWWAKARQCAIIVTSHSMPEVECLCDRVAVLTSGALRCFGAPSHLRATFGKGYVAEVTVGPRTNVALLDEEVVAHFGSGAATVTTRSGGALRCYALGEVPSMAAAYRELLAIAQQCGADNVHVGRSSLSHAYLLMTR